MKFQQIITYRGVEGASVQTSAGMDSATIIFNASSWDAAARFGERHQRDLGMDGPSYSSVIVYAREGCPNGWVPYAQIKKHLGAMSSSTLDLWVERLDGSDGRRMADCYYENEKWRKAGVALTDQNWVITHFMVPPKGPKE